MTKTKGGGNSEKALEWLHKAVEIDPEDALAKYRLAVAYDEIGRLEEARAYYEAAIEKAPGQNPTINRLAAVYRALGRPADARRMYEKALGRNNNPYDVKAIKGLVELDIAEGTRESYLAAEQRLVRLLSSTWDDAVALTDLGAVRMKLGRTQEAIDAYTRALEYDPGNVTAALNLAQIFYSRSDVERARPLFELAASSPLGSVDRAIDIHDFFVSQGDTLEILRLWDRVVRRFPDSARARVFAAWSKALAGDVRQAEADAAVLADTESVRPLLLAIHVVAALADGRYDAAVAYTEELCKMGTPGSDARRRLRGALGQFLLSKPDMPWTFCLGGRILIAEGDFDSAKQLVTFCEERCTDPECNERVAALRALLPPSAAPPPEPRP